MKTHFNPRKLKDKLHSKESFKLDSNNLRFDGVYLKTVTIDTMQWYYFIRFFENGTLTRSQRYCHYPTSNERINIKEGVKGFYILRQNEIVIQEYNNYLGYHYSYLNLMNDSITYNYYRKRLDRSKKVFSKRKSTNIFVKDKS